ncbi:MAG: patatin-like phospholipase family protein [Nitrososphaera sp.]|jgi:NTE family protein
MVQDFEGEKRPETETVLVLQGGGSLGAYECGVFSTLYKHGIKFNVIAGSSIGGINASIIASAQNAGKDTPALLKDFWLELSEKSWADGLPALSNPYFTSSFMDKTMAFLASMHSIMYGNALAFTPRWFFANDPDYYFPYNWNYVYDTTPLKDTLCRYVDFKSLRKDVSAEEGSARLIITATDIQKGEPVIFDNRREDIDVDKVVACASYQFYGIRWKEDDAGRYLWDGSLLTNTPMMEVIRASPMPDKIFYIVDVFPRKQEELPRNMVEVWHRARDIIFMDKTDKNVEMLRDVQRYQVLLMKMNAVINSPDAQIDEGTRTRLKELQPEYYELAQRRGAVIKDTIRIGRVEKVHYLLEDTDFSSYRIKKLMGEGEQDAERILREGTARVAHA